MLTWLCRIMIIVFTFNILAPEVAEAKRISRADLERTVTTQIQNQQTKPLTQASSLEELETLYALHMIELADIYDTLEVTDELSTHTTLEKVVEDMHRTVQDYTFFKNEFQKIKDKQNDPFSRPVEPAVADNTYYRKPEGAFIRKNEHLYHATVEKFLNKVKKNDINAEDLVESLDPLIPVEPEDPNTQELTEPGKTQASYLITAYAAEILFNTLVTEANGDLTSIMYFLARIQQRAFYRLRHLPVGSSSDLIMARNTLYVLLLKIHQLYEKAGRKDPFAPDVAGQMSDIINYVRSMKNEKKTEPGTENYALLKLQMEYAVRYALLADKPEALGQLLNIFEEKPSGYLAMQNKVKYNPTKFQSKHTEIISLLFSVTLETLKFYPVKEGTAARTANWLIQVAEPKHGTDARVLAIGAAAKGYKEQLFKLGDTQRNTLAGYAVDIYHPLNNSGIYGMETYGLDSKQMKTLSDNLTNFIGDLLPITIPLVTWNAQKLRDELVPGKVSTLTTQMWQAKMTESMQGAIYTQGIPYKKPAFILFDSKGDVHSIYQKNDVNSRQKNMEEQLFGARLVGEAVLWIFGGEIIGGVFKALGLTAKAIVAIPKAWKVARHAPRGKKIGIFTKKIRQTLKYSQRVEKVLAESGIEVSTTRMENVVTKVGPAKKAATDIPTLGGPATAPGKAPTKILIKSPVTREGTGYLGGKTGQAGTEGWFKRLGHRLSGDTPAVKSYTVSSHRPGFQFASAEFDATKLGLEDGLNSPTTKRRFYRLLEKAGFDLTPLTSAERGLLFQEKEIVASFGQALKWDSKLTSFNVGSFDYWAYNGTKFEPITPKDFFTRHGQLAAKAANKGDLVADYYALLEIPTNASPTQIKGAYHRLAKELHPDKWAQATDAQRLLAEEKFKQLGTAYQVLGDDVARAAYDLKLANRSLTGFIQDLPVSPEGYSLVITPKQFSLGGVHVTGRNIPGYNPITYGGFGINAKNVTGDLTTQLTEHFITTGQLPQLGTLLIKNNALYQMFVANLIFFGSWDLLDRFSHKWQEPMINSAAQEQVQQELDNYGNLFAPQPDSKQNNSDRLDVVDQVSGAARNMTAHQGYLFLAPIFSTMLAMDKLHLVSNELKSLLNTNAKRIELNKAIAQQSVSAFNQSLDATLEELSQIHQQYEAASQTNPDLAAEYQAVCQVLAQYEKDVQSIANAKGDLTGRSAQLNEVILTNNQKVEEAVDKMQRAQNANLIAQIAEDKKFLEQSGNIRPDQKAEMVDFCDKTISALEQAGKKPLGEMLELQDEAMAQYNQRIQEFVAQLQQPVETKTWDQMNTKEQKKALRTDWKDAKQALNAYQEMFTMYGPAAVAEFKQLIQSRSKEIEKVLNNSRLTAQEQYDHYYPLLDQLESDITALLNKHASQVEKEMDELLPNEDYHYWR